MDDPEGQLEPFVSGQRGFWRKLSGWLRPWKGRGGAELTEQMLQEGDVGVHADAAPARGAGGGGELTWPRRRTSQISRLEEGFDKLVNLVDTIDRHIQKQAERGEQISTQTRRLADSAAQAHGLEQQRTEAVEEMANQYRNQTRQMQQVAEAVEVLPRTIKQQSEQLSQIRDQLEAQLEAQLSTAQGIQQLAGAADVIRGIADDQRRHFQQILEASHTAGVQIVNSLERQNRRFTWVMVFALATALTALIGSGVAILLLAVKLMGR